MIHGVDHFAGSRSISKAAKKSGMQSYSTDKEPFDGIDEVIDIMKFDPSKLPSVPDWGWFSSPCEGFSVAAIGKNWTGGKGAYIPKSKTAEMSIRLAKRCLELIEYYLSVNRDFIFWMENPRGLLRKMDFMQHLKMHTVTYCKYGDTRMKPTDIWTNCATWEPRPMCKNYKYNEQGIIINKHCHHEEARRGAKTGTQGIKGYFNRSKIPEELCIEILKATEAQILFNRMEQAA